MKDTVKNFELPKIDAPVIHGEADIVLKNVKTGLVERIHSENTFQSAVLRDQFKNLPYIRQNKMNVSNFTSDIQKAFGGGLLLFKNTIEVGNYFMPAGNKMVGCGLKGTENLGTPVELGSYNSVESAEGDTSITRVWDFATHQGNGTIGCICLTSGANGYGGYGNPSGVGRTSAFSFRQYDESTPLSEYKLAENGFLYRFSIVTVDNTRYIRIHKQRTIASVGSFFAGKATYEDIEITDALDIVGYSYYIDGVCHSCYVGNNKFRVLPNSYGDYLVASGDTFYYWEYDASTGTLTRESFTNSSSDTIVGFRFASYQGNYAQAVAIFTLDDKVIVAESSNTYVLIFDITDGSLEHKTSFRATSSYNYAFGAGMISDGLYVVTEYSGASFIGIRFVDIVNGTEYPPNWCPTDGYIPNAWDRKGLCIYSSHQYQHYDSFLAYNPMFLTTINNLQSPVTKTAAQTMKVTYTLTEA